MIASPGRRDRKVIAIFASASKDAVAAIDHLKRGGVELPIYLYCRETPPSSVSDQCTRIRVEPDSLKLFGAAYEELSNHWVALGVSVWNRGRGWWPLKVAPFVFPPFRVLIMNEHADFFPGRPASIAQHLWIRATNKFSNLANWIAGTVRLIFGALVELAAIIQLPGPFEVVAQFSSPLSRFVFSLLRRDGLLVVSAPPKRGHGAVVIELTNGEWRMEDISRTLFDSSSRWVVFQENSSEPWEDLLPLFSDKRTFAVSRQRAFQGWLKTVLPSAPFRTLQRDEATQVLAPLSNQIVFDREKLLALGIPELRSSAASFCVLFWKAASAGWRSYSSASGEPVKQMPAMPQAEAQFVQALLRERALARLMPRDAALSRGNIARRISGGNSFRGLPRILVLSPFLPYPLSHGGAVRIYNLCRSLNSRYDLVLACFREKDEFVDYPRLHDIFREVYVVSIDEVCSDPSLPPAVSGYESSSMRALISHLCAELRIDLLQIEYTQLAAYREMVPHLPAILVEHDITFSLYRQFVEHEKSPAAERAYQSWLRFESDRLRAFDAVWTMSEADRQLAIQAGGAEDRVAVVPNGVDIERFRGAPEPQDGNQLLYIGSFRHRPNYLAFRELCDSIMPLVWKVLPEVKLCVVAGPNHEKYWNDRSEIDPRITVHGFVEDVAPYYRNCSLALAPLPLSAGTNIKVMEALACERAIVSTPVGCAGLGLEHGYDALICELGNEFAEGICYLLQNPSIRRALARRGRATAEGRFSWQAIKQLAAESYERLLEGKPSETAPGLTSAGSSLRSSPLH